jgi:hypothetical protein
VALWRRALASVPRWSCPTTAWSDEGLGWRAVWLPTT